VNIVVVESPAKAKAINKYLGQDYKVLASYGHVRDLSAKEGSVLPDDGFAMTWAVDTRAQKRIGEIAEALKGADHLYLATDPDREGEAISWHVMELLSERGALNGIEVKRVVFHEITRNAVLEAMAHPRDLDKPLIEAYLARRALDYLVGFTLSPVLWRKLPGSRSAGRVQSVALRMICEREAEIEAFKAREYWTVDGEFANAKGEMLTARLTHLGGEKLTKFSLGGEAEAKAASDRISSLEFSVGEIERKQVRRHPQPPFTTSTLQQEASRKLGFSASRTMRIAQRLYEGLDIGGDTVGLISYMRTDSVRLSNEAIAECRRLIPAQYGQAYLPDAPRIYKSRAKNAQEAHEAIRPTDFFCLPQEIVRLLDSDQFRLYELIWKRAVASAMESARLDQVAINVAAADGTTLRATGSTVTFDGFLRLYQEGRDDPAEGTDGEQTLPRLTEGEAMSRRKVIPEQHFTQPPPRYTEASLVKRMEELGIGRPSTYASILSVLQQRDYVRLEKKRFVPEDRGRLVTSFLVSFFKRYVEYDFTAQMENRLDDISGGKANWKEVMGGFWESFAAAVAETKDLTTTEVIDALDEVLGPHFFNDDGSGRNPRDCPNCDTGRLGLKLGKYGAFIGCSTYPECKYTRKLAAGDESPEAALIGANGPVNLGSDAVSGEAVTLRNGPYGFYIQLGEGEDKKKPKRVSLPKEIAPDALTLKTALGLLALPRDVGPHPDTGKMIQAGIGRFGPYLRHNGAYASLGPDEDLLTIGLNRAVDLLQNAKPRGESGKLRVLGEHPEDGKPVSLHGGRYGPYVKHGSINATVPPDRSLDTLTLDEALVLIADRVARGPAKKKTARKTGKNTAKKAGTGKSKARKAPARKRAAKKRIAPRAPTDAG